MACARRGAGHDAGRARPPSRPSTPTGCASPRRPAASPSSLIGADHLRPSRIMTPKRRRERPARAAGARRLDQRHHPSDRDRRPPRRRRSTFSRLNELSDTTPVLVDLKPTGPAIWRICTPPAAFRPCCASCSPLLHLDCLTVTGETLGERLDAHASMGRSRSHPALSTIRLQRQRRAGRAVRQSGAATARS